MPRYSESWEISPKFSKHALILGRRGETARERMSMARMQDRSQPDSEDIAKIVKEYLRNDRVMPVVLCKARSGIDVDFDVADGEFKN